MSTKTDYSEEIKRLLGNFYTPVATQEETTDSTVRKTLPEIHQEVVRILPARWIYEDDVYHALQEMGFKYFPGKDPEEDITELFYYLNLK